MLQILVRSDSESEQVSQAIIEKEQIMISTDFLSTNLQIMLKKKRRFFFLI